MNLVPALDGLEATVEGLGARIQASCDLADDFGKGVQPLLYTESRFQHTCQDLQDQISDLRSKLAEMLKHPGESHEHNHGGSYEELAELKRSLAETQQEEHRRLQRNIGELRQDFDALRMLLQSSKEQSQSDANLMFQTETEHLKESVAQKLRLEREQFQDLPKLRLQLEDLQRQCHSWAWKDSAARTAYDELKSNLELVRSETAVASCQLREVLSLAEAKEQSHHVEMLEKHSCLQSLLDDNKIALLEAAQKLALTDQQWNEKLRSETQATAASIQECKHDAPAAAEKVHSELVTRLERSDAALKDLSARIAKEVEERSRRFAELDGQLSSRLAEAVDRLRRQEVEYAESIAKARSAASENELQIIRVSRENSDKTAELHRNLDIQLHRTSVEVKEVREAHDGVKSELQNVQARISEVQAEARRQASIEKQTHAALVAELWRSYEQRFKDVSASMEQDKVSYRDNWEAALQALEEHQAETQCSLEKLAAETNGQLQKALADVLATLDQRIAGEHTARLERRITATHHDLHLVSERIAALEQMQQANASKLQARIDELAKELATVSSKGFLVGVMNEAVVDVVQRELQAFQQDILHSFEWKLERCVQWLHSTQGRAGVDPKLTMFSLERFRQELFEQSKPSQNPTDQKKAQTCASHGSNAALGNPYDQRSPDRFREELFDPSKPLQNQLDQKKAQNRRETWFMRGIWKPKRSEKAV